VQAEQWEERYRLVVELQQQEGHCRIPYKYRVNGINVGGWLKGKKKYKQDGRLEATREKRLKDLGIAFIHQQRNITHDFSIT